jgi:hypothetical protein
MLNLSEDICCLELIDKCRKDFYSYTHSSFLPVYHSGGLNIIWDSTNTISDNYKSDKLFP